MHKTCVPSESCFLGRFEKGVPRWALIITGDSALFHHVTRATCIFMQFSSSNSLRGTPSLRTRLRIDRPFPSMIIVQATCSLLFQNSSTNESLLLCVVRFIWEQESLEKYNFRAKRRWLINCTSFYGYYDPICLLIDEPLTTNRLLKSSKQYLMACNG